MVAGIATPIRNAIGARGNHRVHGNSASAESDAALRATNERRVIGPSITIIAVDAACKRRTDELDAANCCRNDLCNPIGAQRR